MLQQRFTDEDITHWLRQ